MKTFIFPLEQVKGGAGGTPAKSNLGVLGRRPNFFRQSNL